MYQKGVREGKRKKAPYQSDLGEKDLRTWLELKGLGFDRRVYKQASILSIVGDQHTDQHTHTGGNRVHSNSIWQH